MALLLPDHAAWGCDWIIFASWNRYNQGAGGWKRLYRQRVCPVSFFWKGPRFLSRQLDKEARRAILSFDHIDSRILEARRLSYQNNDVGCDVEIGTGKATTLLKWDPRYTAWCPRNFQCHIVISMGNQRRRSRGEHKGSRPIDFEAASHIISEHFVHLRQLFKHWQEYYSSNTPDLIESRGWAANQFRLFFHYTSGKLCSADPMRWRQCY